jgi:cytoskeletal protein CcmA (bactofilin family)
MRKSSSNMIDSFISKGSEFKGEFSLIGNLKLDGVFQGRIISDGKVIVGAKGIGICDIIAREVIIGGEIRGNIIATEGISVLSSGNLKGNLLTTSLSMEEGVRFNGYCKIDNSMFEDVVINIDELNKMRLARDENSRLIIAKKENETLPDNKNTVYQD